MKKIILIIISTLVAFGSVKAQDEAIFNQYLINTTLINPGFTGFNNKHNIFMNLRNAWTGFPGTPKTYAISYNGAMSDKLGLGGAILTENIAQLSRLRAQLSYSFRFKIQEVNLGLGLSTEFHRVRLDADVTDNAYYQTSDPLAEDYIDGNTFFDASLGAYGEYKDQIFFGLSLPNLVRTKIGEIAGSNDNSQGTAFRHFIMMGGYRYRGEEFTIEPSLQIRKIMSAPFQVDINVKAGFLQDRLIGGLTYRPGSGGGLVFLVGTKLSAFQLYYSYDVSFEKFQQYNAGSHELTLGFQFDRPAKKFDRGQRYRN